MKRRIIAPCGIDCFNCELFKDKVTEELQTRLSGTTKIPKEKITCKGCVDGNICLFLNMQGKNCKTADCAKEKGVDYCYECNAFPCEYLMPIADGAAKYPHNIKLFNLCQMKRLCIDFLAEKAGDIRNTYYTKKMVIGTGGSKEDV